MKFKAIGILLASLSFVVSCGTTQPQIVNIKPEGSTVTRALSYNSNFAKYYVDGLWITYGVLGSTFGKDSYVSLLANNQTTPSALNNLVLNSLIGRNIYWQSNTGAFNSPKLYVDYLYFRYLGRNRAPNEGDYWVNAIQDGSVTPAQARDAFLDCLEYRLRFSDYQFLSSSYRHILRRSEDAGGLQFWTNFINQGMARSSILRYFLDSTEYSNCQFVKAGQAFKPSGYFYEMVTSKGDNDLYASPLEPPLSCN